MDSQTLNSLKQVDIRSVDKKDLVDLNTVCIDDTAPVTQRVEQFIQQIRNPYCFRIGDIAVKVNYKSDGPSFQQNIEDLLRTM